MALVGNCLSGDHFAATSPEPLAVFTGRGTGFQSGLLAAMCCNLNASYQTWRLKNRVIVGGEHVALFDTMC